MIFETDRLILRELTMDDLKPLHEILSDPESMQHYPNPYDLDKSINWITWNIENFATYGFGIWAVILKQEDKFIGDCGITMQNINGNMEPEIGYHINKQYTNKGYATEAAMGCRKHAFEDLKLDKIYSYMKYTNIPSQRVAVKNGMRFIMDYEDAKNKITKVYAITQEEYMKLEQ
jgi:RimJ/RimL family protein N-acetyltransferase